MRGDTQGVWIFRIVAFLANKDVKKSDLTTCRREKNYRGWQNPERGDKVSRGGAALFGGFSLKSFNVPDYKTSIISIN